MRPDSPVMRITSVRLITAEQKRHTDALIGTAAPTALPDIHITYTTC